MENNASISLRRRNPAGEFPGLLFFYVHFDTFKLDNSQRWPRSGKACSLSTNRNVNVEIYTTESSCKLCLRQCEIARETSRKTTQVRVITSEVVRTQELFSGKQVHRGLAFIHGSLIMFLFIRLAVKETFSHYTVAVSEELRVYFAHL